jgi:hypothetical protein
MSTDAAITAPSSQQVFAPAVAAALVIVGALSVLFYVVFSAYAPDIGGETDGRANALSKSAVGFAALAGFLRHQDVPVLISRGLGSDEFEKSSLVILTPSSSDQKSQIEAVTDTKPMLIVLPKWEVGPDPLHPGWVRSFGTYDEKTLSEKLLASLSPKTELSRDTGTGRFKLHSDVSDGDFTTGPIEELQTIDGSAWTKVVTTPAGKAVVARLMGTEMYVLSDPDLLNTRGLHDLDTARAAANIIDDLRANDGAVIVDITLAGYRRSQNILRLIFEPPLLGATLCALFAALLLGIRAAIRFGAPAEHERIFAYGKQALADNSAALIAMAHREHRIVPRYAAAIRRRVARAVGVPADERDEALNALLDRMRPKSATGQPLSGIVAEAAAAKDRAGALNAARKLYHWRGEMMHERG